MQSTVKPHHKWWSWMIIALIKNSENKNLLDQWRIRFSFYSATVSLSNPQLYFQITAETKKRHSCSDKHYSGNLVPSITAAVARDGAEAGSAHIVLQNSPTVVTGNGFNSGQSQPSCCILQSDLTLASSVGLVAGPQVSTRIVIKLHIYVCQSMEGATTANSQLTA